MFRGRVMRPGAPAAPCAGAPREAPSAGLPMLPRARRKPCPRAPRPALHSPSKAVWSFLPAGRHCCRALGPSWHPSLNIQPCLPNSLSYGPAKALGDCSLALIFNIFYSKLTKMSAFFLHFLEWSQGVFSPGSLQLLPWASLVRSCLSPEVAPDSSQVSSVACARFATRRIAHCAGKPCSQISS